MGPDSAMARRMSQSSPEGQMESMPQEDMAQMEDGGKDPSSLMSNVYEGMMNITELIAQSPIFAPEKKEEAYNLLQSVKEFFSGLSQSGKQQGQQPAGGMAAQSPEAGGMPVQPAPY